jgi:hypothetical protein
MATYGQYYYDGLNFATATSVYTDAALTNVAPDGWYSQGGVYRQMLNGVLLAVTPCPSCTVPCGSPINASGNFGVYRATLDFGNSKGAAVINFNVGNNDNPIPDKLTWTFNSQSASEYSSVLGGYLSGYIGAADQDASGFACSCCADCNPAVYGNNGVTTANGSNGVAQSNVPVYNYTNGTFQVAPGVTANIPAWNGNNSPDQSLSTCSANGTPTTPWRVFNATMVVPVPVAASDTTVDIEISAPCSSTFFSFSVNCPTLLTGFPAGNVGVSAADVCGDAFTTNIYHVGVNTLGIPNRPVSQGGPLAATPDTEMGIHDWVFTDQYGVTPVPTGWYHIQNLIGGVITSQAIQVSSDGIVVSISNCAASCSNNIFISGLQNACDTFCDGTNRTIPTARQTTTCDTYLTLGIGDVFTGAAITQGWYAYAATSTNTATGPFRIMQIGPNNEVLSIKQCSGANCIAV